MRFWREAEQNQCVMLKIVNRARSIQGRLPHFRHIYARKRWPFEASTGRKRRMARSERRRPRAEHAAGRETRRERKMWAANGIAGSVQGHRITVLGIPSTVIL